MDKYYVEIYNKETDQAVFTLEVINGEFDAAQMQKHDEVLLADTEFKYGRRILEVFEGKKMRSEEALLLLGIKMTNIAKRKLDEVNENEE